MSHMTSEVRRVSNKASVKMRQRRREVLRAGRALREVAQCGLHHGQHADGCCHPRLRDDLGAVRGDVPGRGLGADCRAGGPCMRSLLCTVLCVHVALRISADLRPPP